MFKELWDKYQKLDALSVDVTDCEPVWFGLVIEGGEQPRIISTVPGEGEEEVVWGYEFEVCEELGSVLVLQSTRSIIWGEGIDLDQHDIVYDECGRSVWLSIEDARKLWKELRDDEGYKRVNEDDFQFTP